jgi:uncharacterized protein
MARFDFATIEGSSVAAAGGSPDALFELGLLYSAGRDVGLDLVQAHKWFNLAAMRGNLAARSYRADIARDLSKTDLAQAQRLAREWLQRK